MVKTATSRTSVIEKVFASSKRGRGQSPVRRHAALSPHTSSRGDSFPWPRPTNVQVKDDLNYPLPLQNYSNRFEAYVEGSLLSRRDHSWLG